MWAISLLTIMFLLPLLSAAPLDIAGDIKKEDVKADNDWMHSHDENVTRGGKFFGHNRFDVGNINVPGSVAGDVVSIGHEVKIDVHGHTHDHHHREDDTVECKEGLRVLFKSIDSNKDGLMDAKELVRVCHQNNIQITESLAVRILTLPDKTVGFNMAKFCDLLKDCPSTNSVDVIYFLLQPYDKVAGCSRDEIEKLCWCPRDYSPVCAGGRLYNNLCLHECAKKEAECADVQPIPAVGDIAECVDPSTKGIVNRDAIKEFQMTLLNIEHELANLVNSRRKRDGLGFTEEQLILLNSIEKGYTYLDIECSNNDGQCHVEKIKDSIEETKSSFTAVKEAGRVSSGFLEHFILEREKFDKIADVAGKVQEKTAVKRPPQGIIVDGGWSAWSSWSDCTGTCGEETRTRTRACSSPCSSPWACLHLGPAGGKSCPGAATEAESCGLPSCEGFCSGLDSDLDCCSSTSPCQENEGDCDFDEDCADSLVCGLDNCMSINPLAHHEADCCIQPASCSGMESDSNCCSSTSPCQENEGDCNTDAECAGSLVCGQDNCKSINPLAHHDADCCIQPGLDPEGLSQWSEWSVCSAPCGPATRSRQRTCTQPEPAKAGDPCIEDEEQTEDCELPDCIHMETKRITLDAGYWGDWGPVRKCSFPHFANKMELKIESKQHGGDDTALNAVVLTCTDGRKISSSQQVWGDWKGAKTCSSGYIKSAKMRRESPGGDDTGGNGLRFSCTDGSVHQPGDGYWGDWSNWKACEAGSAVYGIQTKVERQQGGGDDTALNDVRFFCAKIP